MEKYIPIVGYFDLSMLKGNGKLFEAEIVRIRKLYEEFYCDNRIRCCDRGDYPKNALSHMGFRFISRKEKVAVDVLIEDGLDAMREVECVENVTDESVNVSLHESSDASLLKLEENKEIGDGSSGDKEVDVLVEDSLDAVKEVECVENVTDESLDVSLHESSDASLLKTEENKKIGAADGSSGDKEVDASVGEKCFDIYYLDAILNKHNLYCISAGRDDVFYSFAKQGEDKNDDAWLDPALFPSFKVINLKHGVKYTDLITDEERRNMGYSHSKIEEAIQILSGGYIEEKKTEWCKALVLLFTITSEAVRSHGVFEFVKSVLDDETDTIHYMDSKTLREINKWGKISDVAYGSKPVKYEWKNDSNVTVTELVNNRNDVARIFAVIKAPPSVKDYQFKFQQNRSSLTSHHAFIGKAPASHMFFSPEKKSYSTFLPRTTEDRAYPISYHLSGTTGRIGLLQNLIKAVSSFRGGKRFIRQLI